MQISPQIENTTFASRILANLHPSNDLSYIRWINGQETVSMRPAQALNLIRKGYEDILENQRLVVNAAVAPRTRARIGSFSALSHSTYVAQDKAAVSVVTALPNGDGNKTVLGVIRNGVGLIQSGAAGDISMTTGALLFCVQDEQDLLQAFGSSDREAIARQVYPDVCGDVMPTKSATIEAPLDPQTLFLRDPGEHYGAVFISSFGGVASSRGFRPMVIGVLNYAGSPRVFVGPDAPKATGRLAHRLLTTVVSERDAKLDSLFAERTLQTLPAVIRISETRNAGLNELARRLDEVL